MEALEASPGAAALSTGRFRYSLRSALTLTALIAAFCYYRDLPRQNANRFIALIEAGHYRSAEAMFAGERVGISHKPSIFSDWQVEQAGQSPRDWLRGRYPISVRATFGRGQYYLLRVEATATGLSRAERWTFYNAPPI